MEHTITQTTRAELLSGVDCYLGARDWRFATKFRTADEAKAAAKEYGLNHNHYRITAQNGATNTNASHPHP